MLFSLLNSIFLLVAAISSPKTVSSLAAQAGDAAEKDGAPAADEAERWSQEIISWVRASGGVVSEKTEMRSPRDAGEEGNFRGVFAKEALEEGEVVCNLPWELLVKPSRSNNYVGDCGTTFAIYDLMKEGRNPYGRYLKTQPRRYVPGFWSTEGKELLTEMLGEDLPPFEFDEFIDGWWGKNCARQPRGRQLMREDPELALHARMLVIARADDDLMVPFYDMMNHRNGKWYNTHHILEYGEYFAIVTNRRVEAGEQLYLSYNQCNNCMGRVEEFGTPEMFKHYGFVEFMPQRWYIEDLRVKFDIDDKEDGTGLELTFKLPISKRGILYFMKELSRLEDFKKKYKDTEIAAAVPESELFSLWQYHDAVTTAFALALRTGEGKATEEVWEMGDDWWVTEAHITNPSSDDWSSDDPEAGSSWDDEFHVEEEHVEEEPSSWDEEYSNEL